jgi:hypothetical protein
MKKLSNKYTFSTICVLSLSTLLAAFTGAQTTDTVKVKVGDPVVHGVSIKPYKNQWKVTLATPTGQTVDGGTWTDEVQLIDFNGHQALKRIQSR